MSNVRSGSRMILATLIAILLAVALAGPVAAGGGRIRWVDNDGMAGPAGCGGSVPAFTRIQRAVDHSAAGDTVLVCPGTYRGSVAITGNRNGLTVRSTESWKATLVPPLADRAMPEVDMVTLDQVKDVTIEGLRIAAANEPSCAHVTVGILILGATRAQVRGNQIFASRKPGDCGYDYGILASSKTPASGGETIPASAFIAHNLVANFQVWGIAAGNDSNVHVTISGNSLHYYLTQAVKARARPPSRYADRWVSAGTALGSLTPAQLYDQAGIFVVGPVRAAISRNVVQSAVGADVNPAGGDRPQTLLDGILASAEDGGIIIRHNLVRRVGTGLLLQAIGASVDENLIYDTLGGIAVGYGGGENRVRGNQVSGVQVGIYVDSSSVGNIFRRNRAHATEGYACEDDSTGSGTRGTGNLWIRNAGNGSAPAGLCGNSTAGGP